MRETCLQRLTLFYDLLSFLFPDSNYAKEIIPKICFNTEIFTRQILQLYGYGADMIRLGRDGRSL